MSQSYSIPDHYFVNPSHAARLFGVNVSTQDVRALVRLGLLRNVQSTPGGHTRYNMHELLSLLDFRDARIVVRSERTTDDGNTDGE